MFTTTRIKTRDMADVDRLKCLDEGSEHSNCLVIKLIKLRMINHSGLGPVLGGFEVADQRLRFQKRKGDQCILGRHNSGM